MFQRTCWSFSARAPRRRSTSLKRQAARPRLQSTAACEQQMIAFWMRPQHCWRHCGPITVQAMILSSGSFWKPRESAKGGKPQAARIKTFLEVPRSEAMRLLVDSWRASEAFDELRLMPGLICEGAWINRPRATREFLLGQLRSVPRTVWWSLPSFIGHIKQKYTDFQRPPGDFDSWFIKSAADGSYLRGFSSWDQVDGALIRFLINEVMHRLGLIDLASAGLDSAPSAFRLAQGARPATAEDGKLHVSSQGRIAASPQVPRAVRYQLAASVNGMSQKAGRIPLSRHSRKPDAGKGAGTDGGATAGAACQARGCRHSTCPGGGPQTLGEARHGGAGGDTGGPEGAASRRSWKSCANQRPPGTWVCRLAPRP